MAGLNPYLSIQQPAPGTPDWLQLISQGNSVPPDQAQSAIMDSPQYQTGRSNVGPTTALPGPASVPMVNNFPTGGGFNAYLSPATKAMDRATIEQAKQASEAARLSQQSGIDQMQQYAKDLAAQKTGIDFTGLGALADSLNSVNGEKTNLAETAQKNRPMTPDEKNDKLMRLQEYIQSARGNMSTQDAKNAQQILQMVHQNDQTNLMAQHYENMDKALGTKADAFKDRNNIARDSQSQRAADLLDKDTIVKTLQTRRNQIDIDRHTLENSDVVPPQMMDEMAMGIATALSGGRSAGLGLTEKQELQSIQKDVAKAKSYAGKPMNALTPDQRQFLSTTFDRLGNAYDIAMSARKRQLAENRSFQYNPHANDILASKSAPITPEAVSVKSGAKPDLNADLSKMSNDELRAWLAAHGE